MDKVPEDKTLQSVGNKLIRRIDMTIEEEKLEADKQKEANIEKARIRIIADNEKQLEDLQARLNEKMEEEEKKLTDKMNQRRDQILQLKRQNLEDRIKMAGDMTDEQIRELRSQYDREF